jgi:TPR repeat protein
MIFDVRRNEMDCIVVVAVQRQFCFIAPGLHKPNRRVGGQFMTELTRQLPTQATKKPTNENASSSNTSCSRLAKGFSGRLSLVIVNAIVIAGTFLLLPTFLRPAFAAHQTSGQALDQCSIAIVTREAVGSAHICDPKTVRSLAREGHVFEQNQMGMTSMLAMGPGYDPHEALKWFERAARNGYAPAQVNLAVMYINGWGTTPNFGVALQWLHEADKQGYPRADYNLGILYMQGQGVPKDMAEAVRYFRKGAEAGDTSAQTNLGYMYDQGAGAAKDLQAAVTWYGKAAESGNALAQNNLADLYLRGEGVPQDDAKAFRLFQQAAAQGQTSARIKLGYMYANGRGTTKDLATAYSWIAAASIAGDGRGTDLMRALESQLTSDQIAQARENARKLSVEAEAELTAQVLKP